MEARLVLHGRRDLAGPHREQHALEARIQLPLHEAPEVRAVVLDHRVLERVLVEPARDARRRRERRGDLRRRRPRRHRDQDLGRLEALLRVRLAEELIVARAHVRLGDVDAPARPHVEQLQANQLPPHVVAVLRLGEALPRDRLPEVALGELALVLHVADRAVDVVRRDVDLLFARRLEKERLVDHVVEQLRVELSGRRLALKRRHALDLREEGHGPAPKLGEEDRLVVDDGDDSLDDVCVRSRCARAEHSAGEDADGEPADAAGEPRAHLKGSASGGRSTARSAALRAPARPDAAARPARPVLRSRATRPRGCRGAARRARSR